MAFFLRVSMSPRLRGIFLFPMKEAGKEVPSTLVFFFWLIPFCSFGDLLDKFPIEVECGQRQVSQALEGERILPDLPFSTEAGYGHVGGEVGERTGAALLGGHPRWPAVWREGLTRFSFHVPNGEYLVRLSFLETDIAVPGMRVFDVLSEGTKLFSGVDIFREAGDFFWLIREGLIQVRDGWLDFSFLPADGSYPPRISRIRIEPSKGVPFSPEVPDGVAADPGPFRVVLRWVRPPSPGIAGYGVFRAGSRDGPFESLTPLPVAVPYFIDEQRAGNIRSFYQVRAYGIRGGQSPLTPPREAETGGVLQGFKHVDLSISEGELRLVHMRTGSASPVPAVLQYYGTAVPVEVSCLNDDRHWQAKKSYRIRVQGSSNRAILNRRELNLLAEVGDPTLLRQKLAVSVERLVGLPAQELDYIHLNLNGRYQGIYLNRQSLGRLFRLEFNLDRFGSMSRVPGRLRLQPMAKPYGETGGQTGDQSGLINLVHELNRLDEGELDAFFEERFYLDRLIDRLAAACIRGVDPALDEAEPAPFFLEDSRNGKFEVFSGDHRSGDFGIEDFKPLPEGPFQPSRARRSLLSWTPEGLPGKNRWRVLETRLLGTPALRARYLNRVEEILRKVLMPERFDELVSKERAPLVAALFPQGESEGRAPVDPRLWPHDRGASFRSAPRLLSAFYHEHWNALLEEIRAQRSRPPAPLCINEFLLRPRGEEREAPWIEILNRSSEKVDLGDYFLTGDLDRPLAFPLPSGLSVGPGERFQVFLDAPKAGNGIERADSPYPSQLHLPPDGGEIGFFRRESKIGPVPAEILFYGHQTEGVAYGRLPDGAATWAFLTAPSPQAPNRGPTAKPPPWKYRWGLQNMKSGGYRLWLQITGPIDGAAVHLREEGNADFRRQELSYNKDTYRYELILGQEILGRRIAYYYSARSRDGVERIYPLTGPQGVLWIPVIPPLFINEVLPRPRREGQFQEFVEIYNASDQEISIDGMFLTDDRRNTTKFRIQAPAPLPPKSFFLIYSDGLGDGIHANFKLGNAGEYLGLFSRYEEGNIVVDQLVFPAIPVDQSYGRTADGRKGFKVWKDPTPGGRNIPKIPEEFLKKDKK